MEKSRRDLRNEGIRSFILREGTPSDLERESVLSALERRESVLSALKTSSPLKGEVKVRVRGGAVPEGKVRSPGPGVGGQPAMRQVMIRFTEKNELRTHCGEVDFAVRDSIS